MMPLLHFEGNVLVSSPNKNSTMANEQKKKGENLLYNLGFNIIIPVIILTKYSDEKHLGPLYGLIIALLFPLLYGLYDLISKKKKNFISILGFVSILITGIIGIFHFPPEWIAVKEALVPFLIGAAVLVTLWTPFPLVKKLLYTKEILNVEKIEVNLTASGNMPKLEKLLTRASVFLAFSFFLSSALNYILAKVLIKSAPGSAAFNEEIGRMTMLSYPVIALPSMIIMVLILWFLIRSVKKLTGIEGDEIFSEKLK